MKMATPEAPDVTTLRVDFVSDVMCPWCAIGLAALLEGARRLAGEIEIALHFQPFELNPQTPPEGEDLVEQLTRKYGMSRAQLQENQEQIRRRGAELGFHFDLEARRRSWNSFDAHRLLHWAEAEAEGRQLALQQALFKAYFSEGRNVSARDTLLEIVRASGLDPARASTILAGDEFAAEVRERERFYQRQGIHAVPTIIIENRLLLRGGQPPEVFEGALRQAAGDAS